MAVRQLILGVGGEASSSNPTAFFNVCYPNAFGWVTGELTALPGVANGASTTPWSVAGTFKSLTVTLRVAPGAGKSITFTLRVNGVDTALTVTISGASQVTASDTTNTVAISPGDRVVWKKTRVGTPAALVAASIGVEFAGTNAGESGYCTAMRSPTGGWGASADWYYGVGYGEWGSPATVLTVAPNGTNNQYQHQEVIVVPGNITRYDLCCYRSGALASMGATTLVFALMKNNVVQDGSGGTVDTRVTFTGATTASSWSGTLAVARGDFIRLHIAQSGGTSGDTQGFGISWRLAATTDGQFQWAGLNVATHIPSTNNPLYENAGFGDQGWAVADSDYPNSPVPFDMYVNDVLQSVDPATTQSGRFTNYAVRVDHVTQSGLTLNNVAVYNLGAQAEARLWWALSSVSGAVTVPAGSVLGYVASLVPPTPDESWPCNIVEPIFFAVVKDAAANIYKFGPKSLRDASTYLGGYGEPRLLSVDDVSRQASDFLSGSFPVQQARIQVADTDYRLRNAPSTFSGQEAWIFAYSEAIRRAHGNPAIIFHGITHTDNLTPNLTYEFNINDYLGVTFNVLNADRMIPQRTATSADFNLVAGMQGRAIPIVGGTVAIPGTDGAYKVPYIADKVIGGNTYMVGLIAGHACYSVDLFQNGAAVTYGTNVFAPGHTNWTTVSPSGDLFFDINSNRYCLVLVLKSSTEGIDWLAGTKPIYANVSGMETSARGTGTLITDLLTLYKYLMKYWFLQSYASGAWPAGVKFEYFPGSGMFYDVMDDTSWDAASAQSAVHLGGGFIGGFILGASGRQISIRTAIAQCNISCNVFMSVNATNQLFVNMFNTDRATLLGSTRTISDRRDILASPRPPIVRKKEWFINSMGWQWEENYRQDSTGQWNSFNENSLGPSIASYGQSPGSRTYSLIRDSATANAIAGLQLTFGGTNPPGIITWAQSICGMGFGVLSAAPIAYFGGNGPAGWTYVGPAPVYILSQRFTPRTGIVTFTGMDVGAIAT